MAALGLAATATPLAIASDADLGSIRVHFGTGAGDWMPPHDDFFRPGVDLETDLAKGNGRLLTVRIDLNGDDVPESFLGILCGNGGCEYPIFDGRTHAFLGSLFGSHVWLLRSRSRGLPIIETFSRLAAMRATLTRYEFNGSRYEKVSSREIGDKGTQLLFKRLNAAPGITSP
ncbi:MAG: hypothetical protein HZA62_08635 [Rhodocyclales bacterium]|nr:hypothetical protein [Rhodocyclales bacterium]